MTTFERVDYLEKRFATYIIAAKRHSEDDGCRAVPMHQFLDGYGPEGVHDERVRYLAIFAADAFLSTCKDCGEYAPLSHFHQGVCAWGCTPKAQKTEG